MRPFGVGIKKKDLLLNVFNVYVCVFALKFKFYHSCVRDIFVLCFELLSSRCVRELLELLAFVGGYIYIYIYIYIYLNTHGSMFAARFWQFQFVLFELF
jgi:hypothetical protein